MKEKERERLVRWRLILGAESSETLGVGLGGEAGAMDAALGFLYDRESQQRNVRGGAGSLEDSQMTVPDWINQIHELFPKKTIERLEKDQRRCLASGPTQHDAPEIGSADQAPHEPGGVGRGSAFGSPSRFRPA